MGDNVKWDLSTGSGDGDQLRAWFWEPEGTPSLCTDPWEEMEDDECVVTHPEDFPSKFTPRTYGLESAQGTRSAGGWVSMSTPRTTYTMESTDFEGSTVYEMQTIALGPKVEVETNPVDLQGGDVVRGSVAGNLDSYFGPVSNEDWFTVPARADLGEGTLGAVARTAGLDIPVGGNASEDDLVVMVTGEPDEPALLCRKSDDGNLELPSTELSEMNAGWASVSVYRGDFGWTMGPDGLPIRYQALSGEIKEVELR
jgi:hypothetical protein